VIVNVEGVGAPLALKLNLDGTLVGNGASIPIYGQKMVGKNREGDPVYASSSDTCAYGKLAPRGQNSATTVAPVASDTRPVPATTNAQPAPAAKTSAVGSLAISNSFAESPNPYGNV